MKKRKCNSGHAGLANKTRLFALVASLALSVTGCKKAVEADVRLKDPTVRLVTVQSDGQTSRTFSGVVSARIVSNLGFRVPGKIIERLADTGVTVKAGQPLLRIDRTDLAHEIANRAAVVEAAKARSVQAEADEKRYRNLLASRAISRQDYDRAKADEESARSLLAAALAEARVANDNAQYSELCADADGIVVETLAEPGQVVAAGQTVIMLAHAGPREAIVYLPEKVRPAIGSKAQAVLYSGDTDYYPATLRQLSDAADPVTRTFEARYVLDGVASQAPMGASVAIALNDQSATSCLRIPLSALCETGKGQGVWVYDHSTSAVKFQPVRIARLAEEDAVIRDGLAENTRIVALGASLLREGQKVRVAEATKGLQ